jgi:hypothetical protein
MCLCPSMGAAKTFFMDDPYEARYPIQLQKLLNENTVRKKRQPPPLLRSMSQKFTMYRQQTYSFKTVVCSSNRNTGGPRYPRLFAASNIDKN